MLYEILRFRASLALSGHSRSTRYLLIKQKLWPEPVKIGPRARGWPAYEVEAMNAATIAGKSDEEKRALVKELEAARTSDKGVRP